MILLKFKINQKALEKMYNAFIHPYMTIVTQYGITVLLMSKTA